MLQIEGPRLVARYVDIGAVVTKGQKVAKLSDIDYRNRVTAAVRMSLAFTKFLEKAINDNTPSTFLHPS
jgi:hypothetical protein